MKTITLTEEQYRALMQGESVTIEPPKPKLEKWQPKGGEWFVNVTGEVFKSVYSPPEIVDFGLCYPTKEQAEKASEDMRQHNRPLVWLVENDDGWIADWDNDKQLKYSVIFNHRLNKYEIVFSRYAKYMGAVYMSEANAEKLAALLNDGVVVL